MSMRSEQGAGPQSIKTAPMTLRAIRADCVGADCVAQNTLPLGIVSANLAGNIGLLRFESGAWVKRALLDSTSR